MTSEYDPRIYKSCSTVFNGIAYVFGGSFAPREVSIFDNKFGLNLNDKFIRFQIQIRVINDCEIFPVGDLPFDLRSGTCGTFNMKSVPTILLCFDYEEQNTCRALTVKRNSTMR